MTGTVIGHEKDETLFYFFRINKRAINRIIKITFVTSYSYVIHLSQLVSSTLRTSEPERYVVEKQL